jgi:hypothetical protein
MDKPFEDIQPVSANYGKPTFESLGHDAPRRAQL